MNEVEEVLPSFYSGQREVVITVSKEEFEEIPEKVKYASSNLHDSASSIASELFGEKYTVRRLGVVYTFIVR